ncbi:type IV pilus secretin PilQ [Pandoraea terrae]|nr:type IV pilus secretin PilQ [Pandoraea terrae]
MLVVAMSAFLGYGAWHVVRSPARAALVQKEAEWRQAREADAVRVADLPQLRALDREGMAAAAALNARLPAASVDDIPSPQAWLADVDGLAGHYGLAFDAVQPAGEKSTPHGTRHRASWRLRGAFADVVRFLGAVERLPRLISIEQLTLEAPPHVGIPDSAPGAASNVLQLTLVLATHTWRNDARHRPDDEGSVDETAQRTTDDLATLPDLPESSPPLDVPSEMTDPFVMPLGIRSRPAERAATAAKGSDASPSASGWLGVMHYGDRALALTGTGEVTAATDRTSWPALMRMPSPPAGAVSLHVAGADIPHVLRAFAKLTGTNLVIGERVKGRLDISLDGLAPAQALDVLVRAAGLEQRRLDGVVWIAPRADVVADERQQLEARAKRDALMPLASQRFALNYQRAADLRKVLMGEAGHRLLSTRGNLIADPRTNQLFVSDLPEKLDEVAALIARIDVPVRQVLIEARIVEADDRFSRNLGVRLAGRLGSESREERGPSGHAASTDSAAAPSPDASRDTRPGGQAARIALPAGDLSGFVAPSLAITLFGRAASHMLQFELSALEAAGRGRVVSRPRVVTADKVQAIIEQGTELPYSQRGGRRNTSSVQFRKASLRLEVTPQITPDGRVILDVDVSKDSVGQETANGFAIDTKHVKTQVQVESGGTVAIGGIYQQERRGATAQVPGLGDLPLLGNLFRNRSANDRRTELLVFLTPSIVPDAGADVPWPVRAGADRLPAVLDGRPADAAPDTREGAPNGVPEDPEPYENPPARRSPWTRSERPRRRCGPHMRDISRYDLEIEPNLQRFMLENVFFVGLMGAGKTTVGRAVARRLGRPFFDSDHEIEARTGVRIPIIFEHEGEDGFRLREMQTIDELTQRSGVVIATGGGAVLRAENRAYLKERGTVVYLRANPHDLWLRTRRDKNRPLLQTADPRGRLEQLFQERDPLYRECATFVIETGRPSVTALVNMVLMQLEVAGIVPPAAPVDEPSAASS